MQHPRQVLRGAFPLPRSSKPRRLLLVVALIGATTAAITVPFAASSENRTNSHLSAYVVASNRGPLPRCLDDGSNCTSANSVWEFIHVVNANDLPNQGGTRATLPNAFVVTSIDETVFVDGVDVGSGTLVPPPNLTDRFGSAGRWPSTVTCGQPPSPPCTVVTSPAILPGENTVIFYEGWFHGQSDPNGTLVFRFTVHGTLNGTPIDLAASSPPIREID